MPGRLAVAVVIDWEGVVKVSVPGPLILDQASTGVPGEVLPIISPRSCRVASMVALMSGPAERGTLDASHAPGDPPRLELARQAAAALKSRG